MKKYSIAAAALIALVITGSAIRPHWTAAQENSKQQGKKATTIGHDFLRMEKIFGPPEEYVAILDGIIGKAGKEVTVKEIYTTEEAVAALTAIHNLLKKEGYIFKNNLLLSTGLKSKKIDCDNYSALYTAIGEALEVPIVPVYAPNHSFVRFYFTDGSYLNWEPIDGLSHQDSFYVKKLNIADTSIKQGVYLKTLTRKEFVGVQCNNLGAALFMQKKYKEAIVYFGKAVQLYPLFSSAYHNRGSALYALNKTAEALSDLEKAALLDPNRADTHNTMGDIYFDMKDHAKALGEYQKSIQCDPKNYIPYHNIAVLMKTTGKEQESKEWLDKSNQKKKGAGKK